MCVPLGPRYRYSERTYPYVLLKDIRAVSLSTARRKYSKEQVRDEVKSILSEKKSWTATEVRDRYVLEQLYHKDPYLSRIAVEDGFRAWINDIVSWHGGEPV